MGPDSAILLDESDTRVHWQAAQVDLTMMAALGARERTRTQWTELLDPVGLETAATRHLHAFRERVHHDCRAQKLSAER